MENRPLVRQATLAEYRQHPDFAHEAVEAPAHDMTLYPDWPYEGHKWGMAINLSACTGCNACVVACVAENNISVVGKEQVERGREMHWLRIDQYYAGDYDAPSAVLNQPVPCMHCENAPCEVVCRWRRPPTASRGLNEMTYTLRRHPLRGNNCPYKVRRFKLLQVRRLDTESLKLQRNPNVSVRARGVMEKCSYCVQRINAGASMPRARTARCATARWCRLRPGLPHRGDRLRRPQRPGARVSEWKKPAAQLRLLESSTLAPRTTYMARLANRKPELEKA